MQEGATMTEEQTVYRYENKEMVQTFDRRASAVTCEWTAPGKFKKVKFSNLESAKIRASEESMRTGHDVLVLEVQGDIEVLFCVVKKCEAVTFDYGEGWVDRDRQTTKEAGI